MRKAYVAIALAVACAILAACGTPETVVGENWAGPKETAHGQEFTPRAVNRHGVAGWVLLRCVVGELQAPSACFVITETPEGWGLGDAALRTSKLSRIESAGHFGGSHVPVKGESFNLPVVFCPPEKEPECSLDAREHIATFAMRLSAIQKLMRARDCVGANRDAAATGMPGLAARVAADCARWPAGT